MKKWSSWADTLWGKALSGMLLLLFLCLVLLFFSKWSCLKTKPEGEGEQEKNTRTPPCISFHALPKMTCSNSFSQHHIKDRASEWFPSYKEFLPNLWRGPKNILLVLHWAQDGQERAAELDRLLFWPCRQFNSHWLLPELTVFKFLKPGTEAS